ncbi:MAG: enoyl-CoA hydratase/isomerase family protein [Hylemonella sp.]|jgi:enoyl-CoA hydratase/carnithine racemase
MSEGQVSLRIEAGVASVLFDRPQARNAMTWAMYEQLMAICRQLKDESSVRVVTFRGAGGEAFVAGTDIEQFRGFDGAQGVAYERQIDVCMELLGTLPMPTVAVVEGWCVGGGLAIATGCDFRLATPASKFGVPIAKTLGNCLSAANLARLTAAWSQQRVKRMLLLAEFIGAEEALACGYLHELAAPPELDAAVQRLTTMLAGGAPVTQQVSKEGLRRLLVHELPQDEDLIRRTYGSADFREGVTAFVEKRKPVWKGQ